MMAMMSRQSAIDYLLKFREVLIAVAIIVLLGIVGYIIWYSMRVKHPRPFWLNASQDLPAIMARVYQDMDGINENLKRHTDVISLPVTSQFIDDILSVTVQGQRRVVRPRAMSLSPCVDVEFKGDRKPPVQKQDDDDVRNVFQVYLEYNDIYNSSIDFVVYTTIMKHFKRFSQCGTDNDAGLKSVVTALEYVGKVQDELKGAIEKMDAQQWDLKSPDILHLHTGVRRLHFYLVGIGCDQLKQMYQNRMFSITHFLIVLTKPFVDKILVKEVYARFVDMFSLQTINKTWTDYRKFWTWLGFGDDTDPKSTWPGVMPNKALPKISSIIEKAVFSNSPDEMDDNMEKSRNAQDNGESAEDKVVEFGRPRMVSGDVLKAGEFLGPNKMGGGKDVGVLLKLSKGGELVLYAKMNYKEMMNLAQQDMQLLKENKDGNPADWASAAWSSRTWGRDRDTSYLAFQDDGNLVLYDKPGDGQQVLWSSKTSEGNEYGIRSAKGGFVAVFEMWEKPALIVNDKDGNAIISCVNDGCHVLPHGDVSGGGGFRLDNTGLPFGLRR